MRTLPTLTRFRGASWGANAGRHQAPPGRFQPLLLQVNGTSGHARHRPATARKCLLSIRSLLPPCTPMPMARAITKIRAASDPHVQLEVTEEQARIHAACRPDARL